MEPLEGHPRAPEKSGRSKLKLFGCIGIAVTIPLLLVIGIFAIVIGGLYYGTKSTEEFDCAMTQLRNNKDAVEVLGEPINDGYWLVPNIEISGSQREVNFSLSVSGSKSSGTLNVDSYRDNFRSDFLMQLEAGENKLDLYKGDFPCVQNVSE